jgi:uncharacterized protein (DUF433 family)
MSAPVDVGSLIESDPARRGGRPYVAGTGVSVDRVAILFASGCAPEEIGERFDLSLLQVYAALTHYLANRQAIDEDIDREDALSEQAARRHSA